MFSELTYKATNLLLKQNKTSLGKKYAQKLRRYSRIQFAIVHSYMFS